MARRPSDLEIADEILDNLQHENEGIRKHTTESSRTRLEELIRSRREAWATGDESA